MHIGIMNMAAQPEMLSTSPSLQTRLPFASTIQRAGSIKDDTQKVLTEQAHKLVEQADKHEQFLSKVTYCVGVLLFGLFCYLLGARPQDIPRLYCSFFIFAVPLRWIYYRFKKWHYYLLDFCYYANVIFVTMLLFFPKSDKLFMLCFSLSEGPLAWALIVWRCSLVFSSIDKIISVLIHLLPGMYVSVRPSQEVLTVLLVGKEPIPLCFSLRVPNIMSCCIGGTAYSAKSGGGRELRPWMSLGGRQSPAPHHTCGTSSTKAHDVVITCKEGFVVGILSKPSCDACTFGIKVQSVCKVHRTLIFNVAFWSTGTVFFILRWWDTYTWSTSNAAEENGPFLTWPVVNSIPTLWMWLFFVPLIVYCIWQGLYFLVVEGLRRQRILKDPELMTSYRELKRKAERANNIWWRLSGLLGAENRVYMYAILQAAFTVATLALTVPIFKYYRLHIGFEVFKLAATVWNGGNFLFEVMPRQAARKKLKTERNVITIEAGPSATVTASRMHPSSNTDENMLGVASPTKVIANERGSVAQEVICALCRRPSQGNLAKSSVLCGPNADEDAQASRLLKWVLDQQKKLPGRRRGRGTTASQNGVEWRRQVSCAG